MTFSLLTEALESLEMFALLEDLVIHAEIFSLFGEGGKQMSTGDANNSKLVTNVKNLK